MKNRLLVLIALVTLTGGVQSARADEASIRKALQANYDKISIAFHEGKPDVMDALLTPDATLTTPDHRTWNHDRIVSDFKRQSSMMKNAIWNRRVAAVKVNGDEAVATVKGRFHGEFAGQGGKSHVFELESLTVDTWVHTGGAWKLKHADTRELKPKIDGQDPPTGMRPHQ